MTSLASPSPYRRSETPLATRERALEEELAKTRELMSAYSNDEVRISRLLLDGLADSSELDAIVVALRVLAGEEGRLVRELEDVRGEMVARGERKVIAPRGAAEREVARAMIAALLVGAIFTADHLRRNDTAARAPEGTTYGWGGPVERGMTWLYVEDARGGVVSVDGRTDRAPARFLVSALEPHSVALEGAGTVRVRWIPCTTAVVWRGPNDAGPRVERFFNSGTCF